MSELFRRSMELRVVAPEEGDEKNAKDNRVSVIASTENPVEMWGVREILSHKDGAIDSEGACSVLFNHDPDQPIGAIAGMKAQNKTLRADLDIDPEAKARSGVSLLRAIQTKSVRGISIGYDYRKSDCVVTEDEGGKKTITVNRWRLVEISLTPTPADVSASVTSRHRSFLQDTIKGGVNMEFTEWLKARGFNAESMGEVEKALLKKAFDAEPKAASDELAKERKAKEDAELKVKEAKEAADKAMLVSELTELARSYGLSVEPKEFQGLTREQGKDLILKRLAVESAARINPKGSQVSEEAPLGGRDFLAEIEKYQQSNPNVKFEAAARAVSKLNPKLHGEYVEKCRAGGSAKARR